jgi:hypothetical protein
MSNKSKRTTAEIEEMLPQETDETLPVGVPEQTEDIPPSVGAMKQGDQGKPELKLVKIHPQLQTLMDSGILIRQAIFHDTVKFNSKNDTPENQYFSPAWASNMRPNKKANMWFTPHGLVMERNGEFKIIPLANCKDLTL